jgi:hypothetical protein
LPVFFLRPGCSRALRRESGAPPDPPPVTEKAQVPTSHEARGPKIRCPLCAWRPDGKPYWQCEICLTQFDTFATAAQCPSCDNRWYETQCIRCDEMSAHESWYDTEGPHDA